MGIVHHEVHRGCTQDGDVALPGRCERAAGKVCLAQSPVTSLRRKFDYMLQPQGSELQGDCASLQLLAEMGALVLDAVLLLPDKELAKTKQTRSSRRSRMVHKAMQGNAQQQTPSRCEEKGR